MAMMDKAFFTAREVDEVVEEAESDSSKIFASGSWRAVAAALEFRPDAILSDIDLPHRDGFELAQAFADDPAFRHTPIIALTGRLDRDEWIAALESGFTRFLAKPATPDELAAVLAELLAPLQ